MNTTWLNTAEERFAQTLSGARLSPYSSVRIDRALGTGCFLNLEAVTVLGELE
jgi:hypothetical protein